MKLWLALLLLAALLLSNLACAASRSVTVIEGATVTTTLAPLAFQSYQNLVTVSTYIGSMLMNATWNTNSVDYSLTVITPDQAIEWAKQGVSVNGPDPESLIPPPPSQPSQPPAAQPPAPLPIPVPLPVYVSVPQRLLAALVALLILALLAAGLYVYLKRRESIIIEIEIPELVRALFVPVTFFPVFTRVLLLEA